MLYCSHIYNVTRQGTSVKKKASESCHRLSEDLGDRLDVKAREGGDLATVLAIGVRSAEDVDKLGCAPVRALVSSDLDHQTATAGGGKLNVISDVHSLS